MTLNYRATWPFRNTQPLLEWYPNGQRCNGTRVAASLNYRTGSVATWPFRDTQALVEWYPNGQVATAPCSVVECWLACYSSRAVELPEKAARALPGLNRRFHHFLPAPFNTASAKWTQIMAQTHREYRTEGHRSLFRDLKRQVPGLTG